ncbi:hypothetical protein RHMOL_Rhmol01G0197600 [Rhododendron molle]|uniref:Uncharacterized protein n=1 Tax=Rhododendron molle TaxID=49168 RepID=A0ACC0Q3V4_RHOML|nr:hypothetical protein RHMOL_Rhmol01G0197600 [Rhododendron molle]
METSIASSPSIGKEEVFDPTYESNVYFDWGLEGCAMEMEVDKEEGAMDVVVSEPKSQQEGDTSTFGSHVGPATNPTPTPTLYDYTEHFTKDKVFSSEKELVEWTRSTGKRYGFVIIIKASEKFIKNCKPRMRFSCERSGKYRKFVKKSLEEEVALKKRATRSTGTKKIECPFLLKGVKGNDGWTISVHNGTHNHPPAVYLEGHSYPGSYVNWDRLNKDGNVTDLFWAPPCAGEMLRAFPRVLMIDCTYKTNRYKFPLLQIVGVTCTELTFNVAFAFIECEKEENYIWVLEKLKGMVDADALPVVIVTDRELALMNAIRSVFPHATNLLSSLTQYEEHLRALKRDFQMFPAALDYMVKNWLIPYKERSPLFEILRGVVSKNGMTHVLAASRQVEWIVESNHACECALRYTHGLPCAHELAPYKTKNIPLPLELIHDHWKRLSLVPIQNDASLGETLKAKFQIFYDRFVSEKPDV